MSLQDDTQATNDPQGSPCAWCIVLTPLGLIPSKSWFRIVPCNSTAWLDWFPYQRRYLDDRATERAAHSTARNTVLVPISLGTEIRIVTEYVPFRYLTLTAFLALLWAARSVASFEVIWDALAGSGFYSQTPLPFWRAMAACIAIGSLATAVHWFVYFTLHKPITCSFNCVIEISFSWKGKKSFSHTNVDISTQYSFLYLREPRLR